MGKVYLKTKYDNEMKMEIPHNHNFASAMFGFREMAAEIVPYHLIDDIYDDFKREDIALDYIDQCNVLFNKFGVTPHIPDYPDVLKPFLGRKIWKDTINSISRDENKWSAGYFVKPAVRSKAFTGKTISSIKDLMGCGNHAEDYEVLVSESLDIAAEWRCFITYDEIIDVRPYGMIIDKSRKSLEEDKAFWVNKEATSSTYVAAINEEPVVPEYDYTEVVATITSLDEKIAIIKHALNVTNSNEKVQVGDAEMSIDTILIKMAQLNKRKSVLDQMRKQLPKAREEQRSYMSRNTVPEYRYINYDLELIKKEYETVSKTIMEMQMALDKYNQTVQFEVDI